MGFRPHFEPMLAPCWEAFGVSWGPLAPILAPRDAPRPLPRSLLGSLGALQSLQASFMIDFRTTWCHFRGPGANLGRPRALFWTPWDSFLAVLDFDFLHSKPLSLSKPPSLQACKPQSLLAASAGFAKRKQFVIERSHRNAWKDIQQSVVKFTKLLKCRKLRYLLIRAHLQHWEVFTNVS